MPFAAETWASQKSDLPLYAEAAPDLFLDIVEQDLQIDDPKILSLLRKIPFPGNGDWVRRDWFECADTPQTLVDGAESALRQFKPPSSNPWPPGMRLSCLP
jgi:hypothetical protein